MEFETKTFCFSLPSDGTQTINQICSVSQLTSPGRGGGEGGGGGGGGGVREGGRRKKLGGKKPKGSCGSKSMWVQHSKGASE